MSTRVKVALFMLLVLLVATTYSLSRWQQTRARTTEINQLRLETTRRNLGARLRRLPACLWARDFLRAQLADASPNLARVDRDPHGAVMNAILIAQKCVPLDAAAASGMVRDPVDEEARRWSERVDLHVRQLQDEITRSAP